MTTPRRYCWLKKWKHYRPTLSAPTPQTCHQSPIGGTSAVPSALSTQPQDGIQPSLNPPRSTNSRSPKASTSLYLFCVIINIYSTIRSPVSEKMSCHDYLISAACHSSVIRYPSTIHIPHNRFIIIICLTWYYILEGDQLEWVDENKTGVFCAELSYNNSLVHLFLAWIKKTMW